MNRRHVRLGLVTVDQGLSSLTNIALAVAVARSQTTREFGAFAATTLAYVICLGLSRSLCSEPLVIRFTDTHPRQHRTMTGRSSGTALVFSLVAAAACIAIGAVGGHELRAPFLVLGVMMPGLLVQDSWRFAFFAESRPGRAVLNDGLWAVVEGAGIVYLVVAGHTSVAAYIAVWGIAAYSGALLGVVQSGTVPRPSQVRTWFDAQRDLGLGLAADFALLTAAGYISVGVLAVSAGFTALGTYRAAEVLMGPVITLIAAGRVIALTELVRTRKSAPSRMNFVAFAFSLVLGVVAMGWFALVESLPRHVGTEILGQSWITAHDTFPYIAIAYLAVALNVGPLAGLRALQAAKTIVHWRVFVSILTVVAGAIGALAGEAKGTALGLAVANTIGTIVWWRTFVHEQHQPLPPGDPDAALIRAPLEE